MKKNVMTLLAVLTLASMAQASGAPWPTEGFDGATVSTTSASLATTFFPSESSDKFDKEIVEAKEDITYFVSSNGEVRTARFEKAIALTKQKFNVANATDMEISQALLTEL
ncbi:hypothetical protein D3C87_1525370 [compost metagenome]